MTGRSEPRSRASYSLEIRSDLLSSTLASNIYELLSAGVMLSLTLAPLAMVTSHDVDIEENDTRAKSLLHRSGLCRILLVLLAPVTSYHYSFMIIQRSLPAFASLQNSAGYEYPLFREPTAVPTGINSKGFKHSRRLLDLLLIR